MHLQFLGFETLWRKGGGRVKTPKLHIWCCSPAFNLWILHFKQAAISVLKKDYQKKVESDNNFDLGMLYFDAAIVQIYKTC